MADILHEFERWYADLPRYRQSGGPARGAITAALVVLDRLKEDSDLRIECHLTKGGAQVRGVSGAAVKLILRRFDEHRPFSSEGGRTNRGAPPAIKAMLLALEQAGFARLPEAKRARALDEMQRRLVAKIDEWHGRQCLSFVFDRSKTTRQVLRELLDEAKRDGKEGPVAQHLVGAKLALRFPNERIENYSFTTSDAQHGRAGDFRFGDTAFHVTVSPGVAVFERCASNLNDGLAAYLIVPYSKMAAAQESADGYAFGRISVTSIEQFVGGNLDELASFRFTGVASEFHRLLEIYNARVAEVETDRSLQIEIPDSLAEPIEKS